MAKRIVVLGNGIAGITAARHIRKRSADPISVISSESRHFFSRTALMYIYMGHMSFEETKPYADRFWASNRIDLLQARVERVDTDARQLRLSDGRDVPYDVLVLACGSQSNKFGWPGQDLPGVQGLYGIDDLRLMEENTRGVQRAVVVGGGLIGVEVVEMLASRRIPVTFLVREQQWMEFAFPPEEAAMIGRHIAGHGVDLRLSTELDRILPDGQGRVRAVVTKDGDEILCGFVALTVGVSPNIGFLEGSAIEFDRGILVDDHLRTNVPDVHAIGDCAQLREPTPGRRAIEPVWYTGRSMGQTIARTICGEPTRYDPGVWFNSAKFLDLEWQVYGSVTAALPEGQSSLYWEDASGLKSIRIVYRTSDQAVLGFNLMGIPYRHEVCDAWIRDGRALRDVLQHLGAANFDPELFRQHEEEVLRSYNERHPEAPVELKTRRGLAGLFRMRGIS